MNTLFIKILVPIVALMMALSASLYFVVLRTVNEFAQQNIEKDLDNLTHDLFNITDHEFMEIFTEGKADNQVAVRIGQVDCLDILERNTYSRQFKLIVFEKQTGTIRLASDLPGQTKPSDIINHFQNEKDNTFLHIADDEFHVRQFYFSPWDWSFLVLKNSRTYSELSQKVHQVYQASAIALLLATAVLVFYLLGSIKNPIASIVSSVSQAKTPEYKGTYEFEFLSQAISEMMASLKKEVAERKRAEKKAESASQAKSEFLANMSHELRTPLNAILGFTQIMERNQNNPTDAENLKIIQRSGKHLLMLINQVLDLSKIEAGRIILENNCFDLYHLLDELKSMLEYKVSQKGLNLSFHISGEVPRYICTDEMKLRQVLINLLSNGVRFTDKGSVLLQISTHDPTGSGIHPPTRDSDSSSMYQSDYLLSFEIKDTGVGIAQEEIEHIFEAFGQTSNGRKIGLGTGLGLVISKKFIELLGGEISLTSKVGKGSAFSFTIPVRVVNKNETLFAKPVPKAVALEPGQTTYRIMIVDDNNDNRQLLYVMLSHFGFELRKAENGQEALNIFEEWTPHLILMDIRMPIMDGLEATKRIRTQFSPAEQPKIIAVTANVMQTNLDMLLHEGCDDILKKPFREKELFELLQKHLDVKFVYDRDPEPIEATVFDTEPSRLSPADFDTLPEEIVDQLKRSITTLKMDETLYVIEKIREQNNPLANTLQKLATEYRFDTLQKLFDTDKQPVDT